MKHLGTLVLFLSFGLLATGCASENTSSVGQMISCDSGGACTPVSSDDGAPGTCVDIDEDGDGDDHDSEAEDDDDVTSLTGDTDDDDDGVSDADDADDDNDGIEDDRDCDEQEGGDDDDSGDAP